MSMRYKVLLLTVVAMGVQAVAILVCVAVLAYMNLNQTLDRNESNKEARKVELADERDATLKQLRTDLDNNYREYLKDITDVAYTSIKNSHEEAMSEEGQIRNYGPRLKMLMDNAVAVIEDYREKAKAGVMSEEEAKQRAMDTIRSMRYGNDKTDYFWINDSTSPFPTMLMHPTVPALEGQVMSDDKFNVAKGDEPHMFKAYLKATSGPDRAGFVFYRWPKPGVDGVVDKLSYVKRIEGWDWIIGTGIYVDDAETLVKERIKDSVKAMRYGPVVDGKQSGYFWINNNEQPSVMVMHPTAPELVGKQLTDQKYDCVNYVSESGATSKNLFTAMVQVANLSEDHTGYVGYLWPKPGKDGAQPKLSYVSMYEPFGWIIGTGVYIDDIEEMVAAREQELIAAESEVIESIEQEALALEKSARSQMLITIAISLLVALGILAVVGFLMYVLISQMLKPIFSVRDKLEEIAQGEADLTLQLPITTKDEAGQLAHGFNQFINKLHDIIRDVARVNAEVVRRSEEVSRISNHMKQQAAEQASSTEAIAAAMEEMAATVEEVSRNTVEAVGTAEHSGEQCNAGSRVATTTLENAKSVAEIMDETTGQINRLGDRSQQIGNIIQVINDIADQTNLLALNAAIEAARAGDHGRGFAVVADEVRALAERTAKATSEVSNSIRDIQTDTQGVIVQMESGDSAIKEILGLCEENYKALDGINTSSQGTLDLMRGIAATCEEQAATAQEISNNIGNVREISQETSRNADSASHELEDLNTQVAQINALVSRFKYKQH